MKFPSQTAHWGLTAGVEADGRDLLPQAHGLALRRVLALRAARRALQRPGLGADARLTLGVFALATFAWIALPVDDTYVALGAGLALAATGVISSETLFATLVMPRCGC